MNTQFKKLKETILKSKCNIVVLDGYKNVGKTTLSNELSRSTGFQVIHLDEFRKSINYREEEIHEIIKKIPRIIVDGVESMKLCEAYSFAFKVYVNNDNCGSSTAREIISLGKECRWDKKTLHEFLEKEKRDLPFVDIRLDEKLINYFVDYRPFEKADFIFNVQVPK